MRIWHVGASASPQCVDGVNNTIWSIAQEQAKFGHQVALLVKHPPDVAACHFAETLELKLIYVSTTQWRYSPADLQPLLTHQPPHLVHLHSIFLPRQFTLAQELIHRQIPYVVTPHGLLPQMLQRGWLKKMLYSHLIEKPRFYRAAALTAVTPQEEKALRAFVPHYRGKIRCIPNPVAPVSAHPLIWKGDRPVKRIVYLGRFDVLHKGIDLLVEIARRLPAEIEVHLYGTADAKTQRWMAKLQAQMPPNLYLHPPVFDAEKIQVLTSATLYIQMSRWEVFGLSIAEAMMLGVPCAVANTVSLADVFQQHDLGLILNPDPQVAAKQILQAFHNPFQLWHWSKQGQAYAQDYFHPQTVALDYLKLYEEVLTL